MQTHSVQNVQQQYKKAISCKASVGEFLPELMQWDNHSARSCVRVWQWTCRCCRSQMCVTLKLGRLLKCLCLCYVIQNAGWQCAAEQQKHALPKLVGCRVGDGERAACKKGSGCPTLPGPRSEPIMSWGLGIGPVPKGSNAEGNKYSHHCYCLILENQMTAHSRLNFRVTEYIVPLGFLYNTVYI